MVKWDGQLVWDGMILGGNGQMKEEEREEKERENSGMWIGMDNGKWIDELVELMGGCLVVVGGGVVLDGMDGGGCLSDLCVK